MVEDRRGKDPVPIRGRFVNRLRSMFFLFIFILTILGVHSWIGPSEGLSGGGEIGILVLVAVIGTMGIEAAMSVLKFVPAAPSISLAREGLQKAAKGDFSCRIIVSRTDPLSPLLEDVNYAIANVREFIAEDRRRLSRSAEAVHGVRLELDPQFVGLLNRALQELEEVTRSFHLTEGPDREPTGEWVRGALTGARGGADNGE